jgi:hypothetical protein
MQSYHNTGVLCNPRGTFRDVTNEPPLSGVSDVVGAQVRRWRDWHGWSVEELAARCLMVGAPHLTTAALYALESGRKERPTGRRRRLVSADELLVLAHVLKVKPPTDLLVPPELGDDDPYPFSSTLITTAGLVRRSLRGEGELDGWVPTAPPGSPVLLGGNDPTFALLQRVRENSPAQFAALVRLVEREGGEDAGDPQDRPE